MIDLCEVIDREAWKKIPMRVRGRRFKLLLRVLWKVKDLLYGSLKYFAESFINILLKV